MSAPTSLTPMWSFRGRKVVRLAVVLALALVLHPGAVPLVNARADPVDTGNVRGYYLPSQLDKRPYLLTRVDPVYPRIAPPNGGQVTLRLLITAEGKVERMIVVKSDPPGKFDAATMAAFRDARYSPGILAGAKVKSQLMIEMDFAPLVPKALK